MTTDPPDEAVPALAVRGKLRKAAGAFRTISEVADELHIPQHVLRFWETKFVQVRPLKRGGGRRYYRPDDIALLRRVSDLLYIQGYTIKGVQRLLRDGGGKLSDDIPPPDAAEQAAAETERASVAADTKIAEPEHDLPMAGLLRLDPSPKPTAGARGRSPDPEVERLRALLGRVLIDLERLRARLP